MGYLTRVAQANTISSVDGLSALVFAHQDRRITRTAADFPPLSFGDLPMLAARPVPVLLRTTFYHLATKFGRSARPQPLSRFLAGSIYASLRYCPNCLRDTGYYSLTWRFLALPGCVRHGRRLLDICGHCGRPVPLFAAPLRIGICPRCGGDVRTCTAEQLDANEKAVTLSRFYDLVFLLSPRLEIDDDGDSARYVGWRLGYRRRVGGLLARDVAVRLGTSLNQVWGIERGSVVNKGASFATYVAYADLLGLTIRDVFTAPLLPHDMDDVATTEEAADDGEA